MKRDFFDYLIVLMEKNKDIYFVSAGLGYPRTDEIKEKFPERYIQCEASEQTASDICVGLAYSGKIPVMYTITPFYYRCFETIRTYFNHENLHVIMIGAGRDDDYSKHDGYSHDAKDIYSVLRTQRNIHQLYPKNADNLKSNMDMALTLKQPVFISVPR